MNITATLIGQIDRVFSVRVVLHEVRVAADHEGARRA